MYIEAQLVVDGAEEELAIFDDPDEFDPWLDIVKDDFGESDSDASVFVIEHNHPFVDECACVQYLVDHSPLWSNKEETK